ASACCRSAWRSALGRVPLRPRLGRPPWPAEPTRIELPTYSDLLFENRGGRRLPASMLCRLFAPAEGKTAPEDICSGGATLGLVTCQSPARRRVAENVLSTW